MSKILYKVLAFLMKSIPVSQLSIGVAAGSFFGISHSFFVKLIVLVIAIFAKMNLFCFLISSVVFTVFSLLFVPLFHKLGFLFLDVAGFVPLWKVIYNAPVLSWIGLNNTVIIGSEVMALASFFVVFKVSQGVFSYYEKFLHDKVIKRLLIKILSTSKIGKNKKFACDNLSLNNEKNKLAAAVREYEFKNPDKRKLFVKEKSKKN